MARATTKTLLSIDEWGDLLGINPWLMNGVGEGLPRKVGGDCQSTWAQFHHQALSHDFVTREELGRVISRAEEMIYQVTSISPGPKYHALEEYPFGRARVGGHNSSVDQSYGWKRVVLGSMFVQNVGLETWTSLTTALAITPADLDGDSFNESFTATIDLGTAYDPDELAIIFPLAERMGEEVDSTWEIRPLTVSMSGTVVTISGSLARLVKPTLQFAYGADVLDYGDAPWAVTIDIYRHWYDTSDQGLGIWKTPVSQEPSLTVQTALPVVNPSNQEAGIVEVAFQYESTPYYYTPDRVQLNYSAGIPRVKRRIASGWNTAVAYLAISMMTSRKSGCERSNRILEYWRRVPSAGEGDIRPITTEEINSLWGPTRGARWAREFVEREAMDGLTL